MTGKGFLLRVAAMAVLITTLLGLVASFPAAAQTGIVSDDFNAYELDTNLWTWVDPVGNCSQALTGAGSDDAWLEISVPAGTEHNIWEPLGNQAPRIMQSANDENFEIEVKFESALEYQYQMQGVIVEQDSDNFLRLEFYSHQTPEGMKIRLYWAIFAGPIGGEVEVLDSGGSDIADSGTAPLWMRVGRQDDVWTQSYSFNGQDWAVDAVDPIPAHAMTVTAVGVYAGNALGLGSPAHTGQIDYFFDTAAPVMPEDGPLAVELASFSATPLSGAIRLVWETTTEIDNLGFRLYRADSLHGELLDLTETLIPSQAPGSPIGASYEFVDEPAVPGITYYYWLEDVDLHGATTRHGPVSATAGRYRIVLPVVWR